MRITRYVLPVAGIVVAGFSYWMTSGFSSTPRDMRAFRALQERVRAVAEMATPAVVAVEQPGSFDGELRSNEFKGFASGVIISADGLVLSQHHVSHRYYGKVDGAWRNREAGELTTVVLADGREVQAELLGADQTFDLSLLQILEPGPFPFVPFAKNGVGVGDWVLEIGHPLGYRPDRGAVVRLGRVLSSEDRFFATDCNVTGGDSGGPIFDLDGCLVGIPWAFIIKETFSADWRWGRRHWKKPASMTQPVTIIGATSASTIQQCLPDLAADKLLPIREEFSGIFNQFQAPGPMLPHSDWTQGARTTESLKPILELVSPSVVEIFDPEGQDVAVGIVVSADGVIVAIARTLPEKPKCRLANGDFIAASLISVDEASGLALLSVPRTDLTPLSLAGHEMRLPIGSIIASHARSNTNNFSACMGIVSVSPSRPRDTADKASLSFFESDMPVLPEQRGQPVVNLDGAVLGLVIESTEYGCKVLAIDCVATRVKIMQIGNSPLAAHGSEAQGDAASANHPMQSSGEVGRLKVNDQPSPPADR